MSFDEFMAAFRKRVLPSDWQEKARLAMYDLRMHVDDKFVDFSDRVETANSLLVGTSHFIEDDHLRHQLESKMVPDLSKCVALAEDLELRKWVAEVATADEAHRNDNQRMMEFIAQSERGTQEACLCGTVT